jgi:uncharacterized membrane protein HdeD (DUF308 family)
MHLSTFVGLWLLISGALMVSVSLDNRFQRDSRWFIFWRCLAWPFIPFYLIAALLWFAYQGRREAK